MGNRMNPNSTAGRLQRPKRRRKREGERETHQEDGRLSVPYDTFAFRGVWTWGGDASGLGWQPVRADLTPYAGQRVRIAFEQATDWAAEEDGAFVDAVRIAHLPP